MTSLTSFVENLPLNDINPSADRHNINHSADRNNINPSADRNNINPSVDRTILILPLIEII